MCHASQLGQVRLGALAGDDSLDVAMRLTASSSGSGGGTSGTFTSQAAQLPGSQKLYLVAMYTSLSNVDVTGAQGMKCRLGQLKNTDSTWPKGAAKQHATLQHKDERSSKSSVVPAGAYLRHTFQHCSAHMVHGILHAW